MTHGGKLGRAFAGIDLPLGTGEPRDRREIADGGKIDIEAGIAAVEIAHSEAARARNGLLERLGAAAPEIERGMLALRREILGRRDGAAGFLPEIEREIAERARRILLADLGLILDAL